MSAVELNAVGEILSGSPSILRAGDVLILFCNQQMQANYVAPLIETLKRRLPGLADVIVLAGVSAAMIADGSVLEPAP